jgi:hypothetical protein
MFRLLVVRLYSILSLFERKMRIVRVSVVSASTQVRRPLVVAHREEFHQLVRPEWSRVHCRDHFVGAAVKDFWRN